MNLSGSFQGVMLFQGNRICHKTCNIFFIKGNFWNYGKDYIFLLLNPSNARGLKAGRSELFYNVAKKWIEVTDASDIVSKAGRCGETGISRLLPLHMMPKEDMAVYFLVF